MREKYTAPGASVYYYSVQWEQDALSWADFRSQVLGATDPESAFEGSMRREICLRWEALGLAGKPNVGDNGVHGSASAFEGLAERLNWLDSTLEEDETGQALLRAGVRKELVKEWTKDPQVDYEGVMTSLFDAFEDMSVSAMLKAAQKIGGDPFEDTPKFSLNQAFIFIKPHANNEAVKSLVKTALRERSISILGEGSISSSTISTKKLIDNHYYAIANKASLMKPVDLNPPAAKQEEFARKFGVTWKAALDKGMVFNAVDGCAQLGIDGEVMDKTWGAAKKAGNLVKFGGGFYAGKIPAPKDDRGDWITSLLLTAYALISK
jgi:hypothetical protein